MKAAALIAVLTLVLLAPPAVSQAPADKLIVPGVRIGRWTLAMTIADLVRMNGSEGSRVFYRAGEEPFADAVRDLIEFRWDDVLVRAITFDQKTVTGLVVGGIYLKGGWQLYKTDKGIGLESTRDQVLKAYGKPTAQTAPEPGVQTHLIYDKIGIAFRVWAHGSMRGLFVFRPGTAKTIWKF